MLEHLASKFKAPPQPSLLEPRAALILNRFTRTLTIMYATDAISAIVGLTPNEFKNKSFYECIQENCLSEAVRCLSDAKSNDSIAYLRFWYRDPRREGDFEEEADEASQSGDSEYESSESQCSMDVDTTAAAEINRPVVEPLELEAVISCTSDGLVVVLRRAHPLIPKPESGIFGAPWGLNASPPHIYNSDIQVPSPQSSNTSVSLPGGLSKEEYMSAIQEVAVFAWGLTGINGNLALYGQGVPRGEAMAPWGLPAPDPPPGFPALENRATQGWAHKEAINDRYRHSQRK